MGLNAIVTMEQFAALPEGVREHYRKEGDAYTLSIKGELPALKEVKARLEKREAEVKEFRENNIALKKQNAVYEHQASEAKKVVDKTTTLEQQQAQMKEAGVTGPADVRALHERLERLEKERDAAIAAQRQVTAREALLSEAGKAGVRTEAREALAMLAEKDGLTTTPEGQVVFLNPDGSPKQTADGDMTPKDWVSVFASNGGGYMFAPSSGTGGQTTGAGGAMASNKDIQLAEQVVSDGTVKFMG